jgi:response regulator of citrate/malate metabolism
METLTIIQQVFGNQILSHTQLFQWHTRFKVSHTSVDDEHTGRPTTSCTTATFARIQELVHQDQCRTIHDIAEEVGIGYGMCKRVLTNNWACTVLQQNLCPGF